MHRYLTSACAAVVFGILASAPVQAQTTFSLLSSWGPNNTTAFMPAAQFEKNLEATSGKKLALKISGPEAVPPFEQLQPVSSGAFDILYTHPAYHPKGLVGVAEILPFDLQKIRSSGIWDAIDKFYQKTHNMKILAMVPVGTEGYHCYLRAPLSAQGDWAGRKLRGVANQHAVIRALGGVPVVLPMGDVYSSIEKGVVDGACAPANVMLATKHHEVAKYRVEPRFGLLVSSITMNLDRWKKLPADQQKALLDAGAQTERDTARLGDEILARENKTLDGLGIQVVKLSADKAKQIQSLFSSSNWDIAAQCCGDDGKQLRELARKARLSD